MKAVLLGLVTDIGGTIASSFLIGVVYGIFLMFSGVPAQNVKEYFLDPLSSVMLISHLVGFAFSILGGYVCARIVKRSEYRVAGVMAALSAIIGLLMGGAHYSALALLILTTLSVFFNMYGARLGRTENLRV